MDEKVLVSSKRGMLTKIISLAILLIGIVALVLIWTIKMSNVYFYERVMEHGEWYVTFLYYAAMTALPAIVISVVFFFATSMCKMTVTDKRVYIATFLRLIVIPSFKSAIFSSHVPYISL